jgi:hypothetical protein
VFSHNFMTKTTIFYKVIFHHFPDPENTITVFQDFPSWKRGTERVSHYT